MAPSNSSHPSLEIITSGPHPKAFVFDWDDTVFTGMGYWMVLQSRIIGEIFCGGKPSDNMIEYGVGFAHKTKGLTDVQRFQAAITLAESEGVKQAHDAAYYARLYHEQIEDYVLRMLPEWKKEPEKHYVSGVIEFLKSLKRRSLPLYVATANHTLLKFKMVEELGLDEYFDGAFGVGSPEFKVFEKWLAVKWVADRYAKVRGDVVVVGDGEGDIKAAKKAGAYAVALAQDAEKRDWLVKAGADMVLNDSFNDVEGILSAMNL